MKLLCKKTYDKFKKGKYYNVIIKEYPDYIEYRVNYSDSRRRFFYGDYDLKYITYIWNYFYTESEVRMLKLKELEDE